MRERARTQAHTCNRNKGTTCLGGVLIDTMSSDTPRSTSRCCVRRVMLGGTRSTPLPAVSSRMLVPVMCYSLSL